MCYLCYALANDGGFCLRVYRCRYFNAMSDVDDLSKKNIFEWIYFHQRQWLIFHYVRPESKADWSVGPQHHTESSRFQGEPPVWG